MSMLTSAQTPPGFDRYLLESEKSKHVIAAPAFSVAIKMKKSSNNKQK
jgi:hypothetical protein